MTKVYFIFKALPRMTHFLTAKGLEELKQEAQNLDEFLIPQALEAVSSALALGDFKENATLDAARYDLQKLYARRQEIEDILNDYQIIEESNTLATNRVVQIGSVVEVEYLGVGEKKLNQIFRVRISGASEIDPFADPISISNESPLAKAILSKPVGSRVEFRVKNQQKFVVQILAIS